MTFEEYTALVVKRYPFYRETNDWRSGQTYFNLLYRINPDLANSVRSSPIDPFYLDARIPAFLLYVGKNWPTPPAT